jgi:hypothetical protein
MRHNVVRIPNVHVDMRCLVYCSLWLDILRQLQSSKYQWYSAVPSGRQNYILQQSSALCQRCYCALFWSWEKNLGSLSLAAVSG